MQIIIELIKFLELSSTVQQNSVFFLCSEPRNGKSYLQAVAGGDTTSTNFSMSPEDLISKLPCKVSEQLLRRLFEVARQKNTNIIFDNGTEALSSSRSESDFSNSHMIKAELFLKATDAFKNTGRLVAAATNIPHHQDVAFLRQFDKLICVSLPNQVYKCNMLQQIFTNKERLHFCSDQYEELAYTTHKCYESDSDDDVICKMKKKEPIERLVGATHSRSSDDNHISKSQPLATPCEPHKMIPLEVNMNSGSIPRVVVKDTIEYVSEAILTAKPEVEVRSVENVFDEQSDKRSYIHMTIACCFDCCL